MSRVGLIAMLGAAGALARLGVGNVLGTRELPYATFVVNVAGSFALGVLVTWGVARWSHDIASALSIGFLGAFTTFSTFTVETQRLVDDGRAGVAAAYVAASLVAGVLAAFAGVALGRAIVK